MLYRRIRDLREDHDLTQAEMGRILSCSQRVYSNYERGELDIPTEILRKLARYYGSRRIICWSCPMCRGRMYKTVC